jgi:hypothetical protein
MLAIRRKLGGGQKRVVHQLKRNTSGPSSIDTSANPKLTGMAQHGGRAGPQLSGHVGRSSSVMSSLRRRAERARELSRVVCCLSLTAALALAGCASDEAHRREAYAQANAMRAMPPAQQPADVEDDGLPSQVPPPSNRKPEPDDPREPYSPNYGRPQTVPQRAALTVPAQPGQTRRVASF